MKLVICAIRDLRMDAFQAPFCVPTVGVAVRAFGDGCKQGQMKDHPEDFILFELGVFDEETGKVDNLSSPRQIARALDYGDHT